MRWLLRRHLPPARNNWPASAACSKVIRQLQGFEAPANAWERQILKRRVGNYAPEMLDQLCLTGAVGWGRLSPHPATQEGFRAERRRVVPTSVAHRLFVREDADWMTLATARRGPDPEQRLSPAARDVYAFLKQRGASFFADIVRGSGRLKSEVETALWELVSGGLLTADGFDNLRALIDPKRRAGQGSGRSTPTAQRWPLVAAALGAATDRARSLEAVCGMLLRRYGVVFREVLTRESILPPWREVLTALRRLEDRGEVRGGRFVSDFLGEQFALPVAVESLRAMRRGRSFRREGVGRSPFAADPLNLAGILVPATAWRRIPGWLVTFPAIVAL